MSEYTRQAEAFLNCSGTDIDIKFDNVVDGFPFSDDTMPHNKYTVTLTRGDKSYKYPFYDSYNNFKNHKQPTAYDVLSCLQTYDIDGDMWDFAEEFGYEIKSEKTYKRVRKIWSECKNQYKALLDLFGSYFMERLGEIQ